MTLWNNRTLSFDVDFDVSNDEFLCLAPLTSTILILILNYTVPLVVSSNSQPLTISFDMLGFPEKLMTWGVSIFDMPISFI